ncbi:glycine zipper 2TM domain-containing protein [Duganella sp. FT50W]|uniref:Glycine zipper 2TM domain-containing protein n=1 Tax=Duganella lactea TaxID=2692173 RepID=A0A6L8MML8_9BURK|nr:glycine zipper 2TM domain-containing protein [Duganella lactea]MYM33850.1 glycine zipper 2TM domain-containing protein [Duganella lactea]MYM81755.1 glycine zipper 2TM domain-containing protein [Duganella lactea]
MEHSRMHPMMIAAAASVTLVSLLGAASIAGILPNSQAKQNDTAMPVAATMATPAGGTALAAAPVAEVAPAPRRVVEHKTVVHHTYAPQPQQQVVQAPAPAPVAQNSPLGMGIGAVVGGLLGNQVGSGNGRKLATIAGAVGGAYAGNEIAKNQQQQ